MTLTTGMIIMEPYSATAVWEVALKLLAEDFEGEPVWKHVAQGTRTEYASGYVAVARESKFSTRVGQGLPAWLTLAHASDGPMRLVDPDCYEEYQAEGWTIPPCDLHCLRLDWDTAYAGRSPRGETCGDLHARYVATIGAWCDERGLTWWWKLEESGEWFQGPAELHRLGDSGERARAWFSNVVGPALGMPSTFEN